MLKWTSLRLIVAAGGGKLEIGIAKRPRPITHCGPRSVCLSAFLTERTLIAMTDDFDWTSAA
jgi:hypothetical protein